MGASTIFKNMTTDQIKCLEAAKKMVDYRTIQAKAAMCKMLHIRQMYADLRKAGFEKGAKAFRDHVFWMLMAKPDMTERDVLTDIAKHLNINIEGL